MGFGTSPNYTPRSGQATKLFGSRYNDAAALESDIDALADLLDGLTHGGSGNFVFSGNTFSDSFETQSIVVYGIAQVDTVNAAVLNGQGNGITGIRLSQLTYDDGFIDFNGTEFHGITTLTADALNAEDGSGISGLVSEHVDYSGGIDLLNIGTIQYATSLVFGTSFVNSGVNGIDLQSTYEILNASAISCVGVTTSDTFTANNNVETPLINGLSGQALLINGAIDLMGNSLLNAAIDFSAGLDMAAASIFNATNISSTYSYFSDMNTTSINADNGGTVDVYAVLNFPGGSQITTLGELHFASGFNMQDASGSAVSFNGDVSQSGSFSTDSITTSVFNDSSGDFNLTSGNFNTLGGSVNMGAGSINEAATINCQNLNVDGNIDVFEMTVHSLLNLDSATVTGISAYALNDLNNAIDDLNYLTTTGDGSQLTGITSDQITFDVVDANVIVAGQLKLSGNVSTATVAVGAIGNKLQVFDSTGASLGYIPIYASIT